MLNQQGLTMIGGFVFAILIGVLSWALLTLGLNKYKVIVDLREPFNLSGIPKEVHWHGESNPEKATVFGDSYCSLEGKILARIILPNSDVIEENADRIFIRCSADGVQRIEFNAKDVSASLAWDKTKPILEALGNNSSDREKIQSSILEMQSGLSTSKIGKSNSQRIQLRMLNVVVTYSIDDTQNHPSFINFYYRIER
jgi:hypothetical protein